MSDPKDELRQDDHWGVGQRTDGSINVMTEDEAREMKAQRDADQAAFADMLDDETE